MPTFSYHDDVTVTAVSETQVVIKNCTPFAKCMAKIDGKTIDDAENFDLVMPRYNYSEATGSLSFYSKYEATDFNSDIAHTNNFKSFMDKAKEELKLNSAKYCVLSLAGNENNINGDANANNVIFTIICSFCNFISKRQSKIIKSSK